METKNPINSYKTNQFHYFHMHIHKHPSESIPKFTNMQSLSSTLQVCISNLHAQCKPKPQFTHKKQTTSLCAYVYSQASLWIQTKINKYAKFVNYIASFHTTKKNQVEFIYSLKYINKHGKYLASIRNIEVGRPRTSINTL